MAGELRMASTSSTRKAADGIIVAEAPNEITGVEPAIEKTGTPKQDGHVYADNRCKEKQQIIKKMCTELWMTK